MLLLNVSYTHAKRDRSGDRFRQRMVAVIDSATFNDKGHQSLLFALLFMAA